MHEDAIVSLAVCLGLLLHVATALPVEVVAPVLPDAAATPAVTPPSCSHVGNRYLMARACSSEVMRILTPAPLVQH